MNEEAMARVGPQHHRLKKKSLITDKLHLPHTFQI